MTVHAEVNQGAPGAERRLNVWVRRREHFRTAILVLAVGFDIIISLLYFRIASDTHKQTTKIDCVLDSFIGTPIHPIPPKRTDSEKVSAYFDCLRKGGQ